MEATSCDFRLYKQGGHCCCRAKGGAEQMAPSCRHGVRGQTFSRTLNKLLDSDVAWDWSRAPAYFARAHGHGVELSDVAAALKYIFCRLDLQGHALSIGWRSGTRRRRKGGQRDWQGRSRDARALDEACAYICNHYARVAYVARTPRLLRAVRRIQELWRQYNNSREEWLHGPWSGPDCPEQPVNSTDPITLEAVGDIQPKLRFSYHAPDGKLYVFSATELYQYMKAFDTINPYTREPVPEEALSRLATLVERMPTEARQPMIVWRTPKDAFVDVLYYYSCHGFYASVEWFLALPIANIYDVYERMSRDPGVPRRFFELRLLDDSIIDFYADGPHFALAQTMRDIIKTTFPTQFYTICRLFVLLAEVTPEMLETIPAWMRSAG